jgi:hypothetical protein
MQFGQLKRREFITLFGGAAAWPLEARAQQPDVVRRIGVLMITAETDPQALADRAPFAKQLQHLGWTEGQNVRIDYRWAAGDLSHLPALAAELVGLRPDLIVAQGTPGLAAAKQATGRADIRLHADQARRQIGEPGFHLATRPLLPQHQGSAPILADDAERVLADIDVRSAQRPPRSGPPQEPL